jgi:pimeloyl-ACP methyl ester carboxylesterase
VPTVELAQGSIAYRDEGQGPPVVLVHGLFLDGRFWDQVTPRLTDRFRVIVPDFPLGAHRTAMRPDADLGSHGLARLLADFLAALELTDVTLVGNDTGGAVVHIAATRHPERIGRMVLSSCDLEENFLPPMFRPLGPISRIPGSLMATGHALRFLRLQRLPNAFGWLSKRPIDRELLASMAEPLRRDAGVRRDTRKVLTGIDSAATVQAAKDLARFDRPTLWAWAAEDRFFPPEQAERLARTMPNARYEAIPDSWTYTPIDQPERLAALIAEFAAGQTAGTPAPDRATAS